MTTKAQVKMEKISYAGWPNCIRLRNSEMELIATTDVGPRIIRLGFQNSDNIFREVSDELGKTGGDQFRGYGGHRLWHAPEQMPRTYSPDNSSIESRMQGQTLILTQPTESSTGMQKQIEVTLDPSQNKVSVLHKIWNRGVWPVDTAPWALTVMQGPGKAFFPQENFLQALLPVRPMVMWGYTDMKDPRWNWGSRLITLRCDPKLNTAQKIGMMNTLGWAAYANKGGVFIKRFGFDPSATYPDWNCNNETYTNGEMLEVESLGPLKKLEVGECAQHLEEWYIFRDSLPDEENALEQKLHSLVSQTTFENLPK
ncbi:MAG: hypothetical protein JWN25_2070 [Verrucomicrobiales bacterium]|nr:hypothetical protein [Verrucomicrobiales bacterium]MDB6131039.1 hypothetical protein [Verrucomicrobiales bacterium]